MTSDTKAGGIHEMTGANITGILSKWSLANPDPDSGPMQALNATASGKFHLLRLQLCIPQAPQGIAAQLQPRSSLLIHEPLYHWSLDRSFKHVGHQTLKRVLVVQAASAQSSGRTRPQARGRRLHTTVPAPTRPMTGPSRGASCKRRPVHTHRAMGRLSARVPSTCATKKATIPHLTHVRPCFNCCHPDCEVLALPTLSPAWGQTESGG